jgi:hypothetical protein
MLWRINKADNKWEYDLISEEIGNNGLQAIEKITKEIAKRYRLLYHKN